MQTIQTHKNRLPSQAGGFLWKCTSNTKSVPTIQSFGKKVQGQTLLSLNVLQQPACIRRQAEQPLKNVKLNPLQR